MADVMDPLNARNFRTTPRIRINVVPSLDVHIVPSSVLFMFVCPKNRAKYGGKLA